MPAARSCGGVQFNELKAAVYGSAGRGNSYVNGKWTSECSDIMRREHDYVAKARPHPRVPSLHV